MTNKVSKLSIVGYEQAKSIMSIWYCDSDVEDFLDSIPYECFGGEVKCEGIENDVYHCSFERSDHSNVYFQVIPMLVCGIK